MQAINYTAKPLSYVDTRIVSNVSDPERSGGSVNYLPIHCACQTICACQASGQQFNPIKFTIMNLYFNFRGCGPTSLFSR